MIEEFISTIARSLISEGGGWVVAVFLGIVIYVMDKRIIDAKNKNDALVQQQYEKRLEEYRELIEVIGTSTNTIQNMQSSVVASGAAVNDLTQAFAKLLREFEGQQSRWGERSSAVAKQLDIIQRRVETLQKGRAT